MRNKDPAQFLHSAHNTVHFLTSSFFTSQRPTLPQTYLQWALPGNLRSRNTFLYPPPHPLPQIVVSPTRATLFFLCLFRFIELMAISFQVPRPIRTAWYNSAPRHSTGTTQQLPFMRSSLFLTSVGTAMDALEVPGSNLGRDIKTPQSCQINPRTFPPN
jgi:hypothetical protein